MAATTRLRLLGAPTLESGGPVVALPFERRSQLLAWLALDGGWVGRRDAAALLWPELPDKLASANLRKTLFRLPLLPWAGLVQTQGGALRFDGECDVRDFEQALRDARPGDALELCRGDLLAGWDDPSNEAWTSRLSFERERLRTAWRAGALAWLEGDPPAAAAVALCARLLESDPYDQTALQVQLLWLARTGQPSAARQVHQRFVLRLQSELGLAPSAELLALAPTPTPPPARAASPSIATRDGRVIDAGFVGRAAELRHIASQLAQDDCRLLSLLGPGGIGKTRLAQRALQELSPGYGDDTALVALEDLPQGSSLADALARALGVRSDASLDAMAAVTAALRRRRMLLVIDNFETLLHDAPRLPELLRACPDLDLLVTSRVRLGLAEEWAVPLQGLPCPDPEDIDRIDGFDAVELFARSARRVRPDFAAAAEAEAIVEICRRVDGLPLALELAAAWVRVLSCRQIAQELATGVDLLQDEDGRRPPRHASLETVFEHSWQRLSPRERDALSRLAVCRGGFTPSAARAVAAASMPVLASLVDRSMLHKDGERLRLHPLVQQLVRLRTDATLWRECADSHAAFYLQALARMRRATEFGEREALEQLDVEHDNFRAAWRHAATSGPAASAGAPAAPAQARLLADAALTLMFHSDHRGLRHQGLALGRWAAASAAAAAQPSLRAVALAACAHLEHRLDRDADAERTALQALAVAQEPAQHDARALALKVLGMVTMRQGRLDDSRRHHEQALQLADEVRDPDFKAVMLGNLALVERRCGRVEEAAWLLGSAVEEHRRAGDAAREARCLNNLGALVCDLRDFKAATGHFREALVLCERHGLRGTLGMVLGNLAYAALESGDFSACERHGRRALEQLAAVEDRASACSVHHTLALLALQRAQAADAAAELAASTRLALALQHEVHQLLGLVVFARWLSGCGETVVARRLLQFVGDHRGTTANVRQQVDHALARLAEAPTGELAPPWAGPALDELSRRIVDEAGDGFQALRLELRQA